MFTLAAVRMRLCPGHGTITIISLRVERGHPGVGIDLNQSGGLSLVEIIEKLCFDWLISYCCYASHKAIKTQLKAPKRIGG